MSRIIGIVPPGKLFQTEDPYYDVYTFINNYGKRIYACGAVPLGILPDDGVIPEEALEQCDAFVIAGGSRIHPYHLQVVDHCVRTGKKLLGICLGMQAIHTYFIVDDAMNARGFEGTLAEMFDILKKERVMFTLPVEHHWDVNTTRDNLDECKHLVRLEADSHIARLTGRTELMGATLHHYAVNQPSARLVVSGHSEDGSIEAVEYGDNIIGVQFHPEVDTKLMEFFEFVCGE